MKQHINRILIVFLTIASGCKSSKIISINKSQTVQHDDHRNITHVMSSHDVEIKSKEASKLNKLGIKNGKLGNYKLARNFLKQAIKIEGKNATIYGNLGLVEMLSGNDDDATKYFLQSIKTNPNYIYSYVNLGVNYYSNKKYNQALEIYSKIVALNLKDDFLIGSAYLNMANSYFMLKKYKKAKSSLEMGKKLIGKKVYKIFPNLIKEEKDILEYLKKEK